MARDNLMHSVEIDGLILNLGAVELETARIRSQWEDAQNAMDSWIHAEGPTGAGSGDITLMATHTPGNLLLSIRLFSADSWRRPYAKRSTQ